MAPVVCKVVDKFEEPLQGVYVMLECFKLGIMSSFDATTTEGGTIEDWLPSSGFIGEPSDLVPALVDSKDYSSCRMVFMTCSHYGPNVNPWPFIQVDVRLDENHGHSVQLCLSRHRYEVQVEVTPRSDTVPLVEQERHAIAPPLSSPPGLSSPWPAFLKEEALSYWPASPVPLAGSNALDCINGLDHLGDIKEPEAPGEREEPGELDEKGEGFALTHESSEEDDPDYHPPSPSVHSEVSGVEHDPIERLHSANGTTGVSDFRLGPESPLPPKRRGRPRKIQIGDVVSHGVQKAAKPKKKRGRPAKNSM
ncbi:hypothetical protein F4679DRAFT_544140 [Xylaria curta]|nr:hypothetical protein F4679DRAFT_544140 [Xylaria curta]